jgi:hypothetical protein
LRDRKKHSSIPDVQYFKAADCDTHLYHTVVKVRDRLSSANEKSQIFIRGTKISRSKMMLKAKDSIRLKYQRG